MQTIHIPSKTDIHLWVREIMKTELQWFTKSILPKIDIDKFPGTHPTVKETDSVNVLGLSIRVQNALNNGNIFTIGELIQRTPVDLLKCRNFGRAALCELEWKLARVGYTLK